MIKRFWITMGWLQFTMVAFAVLSWLYLVKANIGLTGPTSAVQLLILPTDAPSLWSFALPAKIAGWVAPMIVLLVRVLLTGGLYGTFVRANAGESSSLNSFLVDAGKSFPRLLLWYVVWMVASFLALDIVHVMQPLALAVGLLLLVLRFLFLFANTALVCEQNQSLGYALKSAVTTLSQSWMAMLPYGIGIVLLSGGALYLSGRGSLTAVLLVGIVYSVAVTWLIHMIVARYIYYSGWRKSQAQISA